MRRKVTLNEKQFKNIIKESVRRTLNEMEDDGFNDNNPNTTWYDALETAKKQLANGVPVEEVFDSAHRMDDYTIVGLFDRYNILDEENAFLCDRWYDHIYFFTEGFCPVYVRNKGVNFINRDGKELCDHWYARFDFFTEGFAVVEEKNKGLNFINRNGDVVFERWFDDAYAFRDGFAEVKYKGKWYLLRKDGVLCDEKTKEPIEDGATQMSESLINRLVDNVLFENKLNKKRKK